MAGIVVDISGVLHDKIARTSRPVLLRGELTLTGLTIGGGPLPGGPGGGPGGPVDPGYGYPERPVDPGWGYPERPVDPGYGISADRPAHPIVLPDPPTEPPTNPPDAQGWVKPPPEGGWGYHETYHWLYNPGPGQAGPKG